MGRTIKLILFAILCLVSRAQLFYHHEVADYSDEDDHEVHYADHDGHNTDHDEDIHKKHMCPEIKEYEENVVIPFNYTVQETRKSWCFSFSLRCSKTVNVTKVVNKTISVLKTKTIYNCCKGYEKVNNDSCQAVCSKGCVHGNCALPNLCECDAGWEGANCTKECSEGFYGSECDFSCDCNNGETCDRFNGTCDCIPGYIGKYCETACEGRIVGDECVNECRCENGGQCNVTDLTCECTPGYQGNFCEEQCSEGTFGDVCSGICTCDKGKTERCNPVTGKCECIPGWKGDNCNKPCETGTWGRQCDNKCNCGPNGTCHPVLGQCFCPPGWHGINCEDKCPNGFFDQDCKMKCPECPHEPGTCHHETGWCNCSPGVTGPFCHLECPVGKYGANCEEFCLCNNNSTCDSVTGECSCTPGWMGPECSMPCPEGTYGINCSMSCNCSKTTDFCDTTTGSCTNLDKLIGQLGLGESSLFPSVYFNALMGVFGFTFIVVVLAFLTYELSKQPYFSNSYQNLRIRFQGRRLFKASELNKEVTSTTNVFQEEISSVNPSGQFMNPMYENTEGIEKSIFRPTSKVHPVYGTNEPNHNTDNFEEVEFAIPEPVYSSASLGTPIESSDIRISFGNDFQRCEVTPIPVIKYSNSGKAYFFSQPERKLTECPDNINVENEKHRYENITEDVIPKITKE